MSPVQNKKRIEEKQRGIFSVIATATCSFGFPSDGQSLSDKLETFTLKCDRRVDETAFSISWEFKSNSLCNEILERSLRYSYDKIKKNQ
jgi:hypothetical protein